jgi:hypothetical protein
MYHQHALVEPRMEAFVEEIRAARLHHGANRSSPREPGWVRSLLARGFVLTGARIHGSAPAVIGDRIVLLEIPRDDDLPVAA